MGRQLAKLLSLVLGLLVPLGLFVLLFLALVKPFNLISRLVVLVSPYRKLLPYMIAQARHETNDYKSNLLKTHNNLFGMKHASVRKQVGEKGDPAPDGGNYQRYRCQVQSVRDQLLYLSAVKFPTSLASTTEFVNALAERGYFGSNPSAQAYSIYWAGVNRFIS